MAMSESPDARLARLEEKLKAVNVANDLRSEVAENRLDTHDRNVSALWEHINKMSSMISEQGEHMAGAKVNQVWMMEMLKDIKNSQEKHENSNGGGGRKKKVALVGGGTGILGVIGALLERFLR